MRSEITRYRRCGAVLLVASLCAGSALADSPGRTAVQTLELAPDARSASMGGAFTGVADDAASIRYNPAGLGTIYHTEIPLSTSRWLEGMNYQFYGIVYSLRDVRTENVADLGTVAVAVTDLNSGDIIGRNALGLPTGNFRARDQIITLSYGKVVLHQENAGTLYAGVSGNLISQEIRSSEFSGTGFDAGILWRAAGDDLSLGLALQNVGDQIRYVRASSDLPSGIRAGAAYRSPSGFLLALDVTNPRGSPTGFLFGGEYFLNSAIVVRAGYASTAGQGSGLTMGAGVRLLKVDTVVLFAREIDIDYALVPYGELGDTHRLSLLLKLGVD